MSVETMANLPMLLMESPRVWRAWLDEHHAQSQGAWLKIAKKDAAPVSVTYAEALEEALCYGWIDGQKKAYDEAFWLQKFTPRRRGSVWSKVNVAKAEQLIASGAMQPAGLREVEAARQDGRWDAAYASQRDIAVPADFLAELEKNPGAKAFFATLNSVNRYAICFRIQTARKPETRRARIAKFVAMLARNEKLHP